MPAYLIANIELKDPTAYQEYIAKVPALIRKHGGEYMVRGGQFVVVEGEWKPNRIVILRFADMNTVRAFYDDPDYEPLKQLRKRVATTDMVFIEGA